MCKMKMAGLGSMCAPYKSVDKGALASCYLRGNANQLFTAFFRSTPAGIALKPRLERISRTEGVNNQLRQS